MTRIAIGLFISGCVLISCASGKRSKSSTTTKFPEESLFADRHPCVHSVFLTTQATAQIGSNNSSIDGSVQFDQADGVGMVSITGHITGLEPGPHGFHVHEYGNLQGDCDGAGGHYNPDNYTHGNVYDAIRHAGDLGNIIANSDGMAEININTAAFTLNGIFNIVGRSVVVHEDVDDLGKGKADDSKSNGHSGRRLACGVIGITDEIANPAYNVDNDVPY